jgi:hypothetical protein
MTERRKGNYKVEILSWLRDHHPVVSETLDELAAQLQVSPEFVRNQLQSLQRYECVKRGGRDNAEWSITDQGLVRLADGRFTRTGDFVSPFESTGRPPASSPDQIQPVTMITIPVASEEKPQAPDVDIPDSSPRTYEVFAPRWGRRTSVEREAP